jgi:hypothetical protein
MRRFACFANPFTRLLPILFAGLAALFNAGQAAAQAPCGHRLLVSGYFSNNVHVYDACTGAFQRTLDTANRLAGAQAIRVGPDGLIYVVAEQGRAIHKYKLDTLDYAGLFANTPPMGPLSIDFAADGTAYVAGYDSNDVKKFDRSGTLIGAAFPAGSSGISGPEIGTTFGPDGNLYVPGYDSNNVIRFDPRTGATSVAITTRQGGISRPRGLLLSKDREYFFLVTEQSGQVMKWKIADGTLTELARGFPVATMAAYAPDGNLLVATSNSVAKIDPNTGARLGTLVTTGSGGLSGSTFIAVVPTSLPAVDRSQIGTQYWVVGDAPLNGRVLDLPNVYTGTGTSFGDGLKFSELSIKRWGSVRIEWLSCTRARFSWRSTGTNTANFGDGEYEITRFFANENDARCTSAGIDAADKSWLAGNWWGGDSRSGEGLFLDRRQDGTVFFAWFTHRPATTAPLTPDTSQIGTQFWVVGNNKLEGNVLNLPEVYTGTGTTFGPGLKFSDLSVKRWGTIRIEFLTCNTARFSWDSTGTNSGQFGAGAYELQRYFANESSQRCQQTGIAAADKSWLNGNWWGGDARSGEGLFLDRNADGTVFLAWFTHRPK